MIDLESVYFMSETQSKLTRQVYGALILLSAKVATSEPTNHPNHAARAAFVVANALDTSRFRGYALWLSLTLLLDPEVVAHASTSNYPDDLVMSKVEGLFNTLVAFAAAIQPA